MILHYSASSLTLKAVYSWQFFSLRWTHLSTTETVSFCLSFKEAERVCFSCSVSTLKFSSLVEYGSQTRALRQIGRQRCSLLLSVSIRLCALPWIYNTFQSQLGHDLHTQQAEGRHTQHTSWEVQRTRCSKKIKHWLLLFLSAAQNKDVKQS